MARAIRRTAGDPGAERSAALAAHLEIGRPAGGERRGQSPVRTFRLPTDMDCRLVDTARSEGTTPSELVRKAVAEYLIRHSS
ncbi:hypothetical protein [Tsukamurella soli]|uniref:Ribbon-helix-helix protein, copG family n=1 Tax=Tsukamurella soli TaxID=644556 RepID=A0ABP8JAL7_9ACTN